MADAAERLLYPQAGSTDAVCDIDYTGEFFKLEEELATDGVIIARGDLAERDLRLRRVRAAKCIANKDKDEYVC